MRNKLRSVIRYIVTNYPYPGDLTRTRVMKMIYLVDWKSTNETGKQITNIKWDYNNYGAFTNDVANEIKKDKSLIVNESMSNFGTIKYLVEQKNKKTKFSYNNLTPGEIEIIDYIIETTQQLNFIDFIDFVYNTNPVKYAKNI